ncbi:MAG: hypothetical protein ACTSYU_00390 [Promethearchaeota archaeon]
MSQKISKQELLKLLTNLYFYYVYADFGRLKALFQATLIILISFLRGQESNVHIIKRLQNFVEFEKLKPPHAAPINDFKDEAESTN